MSWCARRVFFERMLSFKAFLGSFLHRKAQLFEIGGRATCIPMGSTSGLARRMAGDIGVVQLKVVWLASRGRCVEMSRWSVPGFKCRYFRGGTTRRFGGTGTSG